MEDAAVPFRRIEKLRPRLVSARGAANGGAALISEGGPVRMWEDVAGRYTRVAGPKACAA